jgi:hypothetical protein
MSESDDFFTTCDWCGRGIAYGNATVTLNHNIEQVDRTGEAPDGVVTVISSECLLELCAECGNRLDTRTLQNLLVVSGPPLEKSERFLI